MASVTPDLDLKARHRAARLRALFGVVAVGLGLAALAAAPASAGRSDTELVVEAVGVGGVGTSADVLNASMSADARFVAFDSDSPSLHPDDRDDIFDVFVVDRRLRRTTLVSRATGRRGRKGDEESGDATISPDGGFVVFDGARDIAPSVPDGHSSSPLYVRDLARGSTVVVSRASGRRGRLADGASYDPQISEGGRYVAFDSEARNLHPDDRGEGPDVFVRDLRTARTVLVSRASGARGRHGNERSEDASMSADGRFVAFESRASNLHPEDRDGGRDVFVRDLRTHRTVLVNPGKGVATNPSISPDGRYVAFTYHGAGDLDPADTDRKRDVYLKELRTAEVTLVSRSAGSSDRASVSQGGRRVVFESTGPDLDPSDTDTAADVFAWTRAGGTTALVSRASGPEGAKATGGRSPTAGDATTTPNGRWVVFESNATNLDPRDVDEGFDAFLRDLGPPA